LGRVYWWLLVYSYRLCCPGYVRRCAAEILLPFKNNRVLCGRDPRGVALGALYYSYILMDEKSAGTLLDWSLVTGVSDSCISKAGRLIAESVREVEESKVEVG